MKAIHIFLISLILYLICSPLRILCVYYAIIIESIAYSLVTYLSLKKCYKKHYNIISAIFYIVLGRVIIECPLEWFILKARWGTLIVTISVILSIVLTRIIYLYYKRKIYKITLSLICWWYCIFGKQNLIQYLLMPLPLPTTPTSAINISRK